MDRSKPYKPTRYIAEDQGFKSECWIWQLKIHTKTGYGMVRVGGKDYSAHRWYYEQARGSIPDGMWIDHLCRVKECVNPDHLEVVTPQRNTRRGLSTKTDQTGEMIYTLATSGNFSDAEIAHRFGVSRQTVALIRQNGADELRRPRSG
jgi:hypothetical protein